MMTMPTYNALQFHSKAEHTAALYDACNLIIDTYMGSGILDGVTYEDVTAYQFMKYAQDVMNQIAEGVI
jgi:hypothetical protein